MPLYEKLDDCQKRAVRKAIRLKGLLILFEQGVGKTHPTISIIEELQDPSFCGFLVVPLSNIETTWCKMISANLTCNWTRDWDEFKSMPTPKLFLTNYEAATKLKDKMKKIKWSFGCFDESQRLKARGTAASRLAAGIKDCAVRLCLSGTPTDGDPIHFFGQLRFAVPHLYGNDRSAWTRFDERFLKPTGYMGYQRKFKKEMLPVFLDEIAPYCYRVEAADVLDLPPVTTILVPVELQGEQERLYRKMEADMVAHIKEQKKIKKELTAEARRLKEEGRTWEARQLSRKNGRISAGLKITQMVKLQQMTGGYVVDDEGEMHLIGSKKIRKLEYILECKAKLPVVIFCKYTEERKQIEALMTQLGYRWGAIHGAIKDKKKVKARSDVQRKFQTGQLDGIVCQVRAGGVGVDLYYGRTTIFYSTTFSYIDYEQCRKRTDRRGQEFPTDLFFLFAKNTIDEDLYSAIISKQSVSKSVFKHMRKRSLRNG